jgi:HK97 family phage portal protein
LALAASDGQTAVDHRREFWESLFTLGRGLSFIERNGRGEPINLWPLDPANARIKKNRGVKTYSYRDGMRTVTYYAREVLDLSFMGGGLGSSVSPIYTNADTIGLALAATRYGARIFGSGGIPPFAMEAPIKSADAVDRAGKDLSAAIRRSVADNASTVILPNGHKLHNLGLDPEKMQLVGMKRFLIEEIARIYGLPPVFLQDLTHGTFSNTEQQDLHLVKHVVAQWAKMFEQEATLKLWGRARMGEVYAEHNLDGLMRGDLLNRAKARGAMIASGQMTMNEARRQDNRPPVAGGDVALVQGAMVPAEMAGAAYKKGESDDL